MVSSLSQMKYLHVKYIYTYSYIATWLLLHVHVYLTLPTSRYMLKCKHSSITYSAIFTYMYVCVHIYISYISYIYISYISYIYTYMYVHISIYVCIYMIFVDIPSTTYVVSPMARHCRRSSMSSAKGWKALASAFGGLEVW